MRKWPFGLLHLRVKWDRGCQGVVQIVLSLKTKVWVSQLIAGLIPSQGTHRRQPIHVCLSCQCFSLSFSSCLSKINKHTLGQWLKKQRMGAADEILKTHTHKKNYGITFVQLKKFPPECIEIYAANLKSLKTQVFISMGAGPVVPSNKRFLWSYMAYKYVFHV